MLFLHDSPDGFFIRKYDSLEDCLKENEWLILSECIERDSKYSPFLKGPVYAIGESDVQFLVNETPAKLKAVERITTFVLDAN